MSQYDVGTVLWIIHTDRPGLVAYRVVEEITKKTLDGEKIQYIAQPAVPNRKPVQLESVKGHIFLSAEEAKFALIENATKAIDAMINKTQKLINQVFQLKTTDVPPSIVRMAPPAQKKSPEKLKMGYQWVEMEDGKKVQVKIPENLL